MQNYPAFGSRWKTLWHLSNDSGFSQLDIEIGNAVSACDSTSLPPFATSKSICHDFRKKSKEKINTNNLRGRNISVSEAMEICTEVISFANLVFEFYKYKKDKNETVEKKELKKIIRDDTKILTETQKEEIIELIDKEFND